MIEADTLIFAKQIATLKGDARPRRKEAMNDVGVINQGAIAIKGSRILAVGESEEFKEKYKAEETHDFSQSCITPGLVDCHTHLVYAGSRERDFYERIAGVSYEEIAKRGGGIRDSVRQMRKASKEELIQSGLKRLRQALRHGTTTCEVKSGYGLTLEDELKSLETIRELSKKQPIFLVSTFLGAHDVPDEYRDDRNAYIQLVCEEMLPQIAERKLARYCDIFTEKDYFTIEESRHILTRARELGFQLKLHVDELAHDFGGAELAAEVKAVSADHLVTISKKGIRSLAESETLAVLLPATTFFLGKDQYAPAREMLDTGVLVAVASDLNPGSSNTESLQVVMSLAALKLKMSAEEILTSVTHNAACAMGESTLCGRLEAGLFADVVVWDLPDYRQIPYHFGGNRVHTVFKAGKLVWNANS